MPCRLRQGIFRGIIRRMEKIKGYIEHFVYRNEDNGYGVATVISDGDEITCVGTFRDADVGDTLEIEGELVQHPMYGDQIRVSRYTIIEALAVTDFRRPRLSWLDGRCVQGPGTYSPRHG